MKKFVVCALLGLMGFSVNAGGSAWITCGNSPVGVYHNGELPLLHVSYSPGGDAGVPGLFWLGVATPGRQYAALLSGSSWVNYNGGNFPFQSRYDSGLSSSMYVKIDFPGGGLTTGNYVGYEVGAGHGIYTSAARSMVEGWMTVTNENKSVIDKGLDEMKANSGQRAAMNNARNSGHYMHALIQKDMTDNNKYSSLLTVPFVDCTPLPEDGGL